MGKKQPVGLPVVAAVGRGVGPFQGGDMGTTDGFSARASMRKQGLLRFGVALRAAAAKGSPGHKGSGQNKRQDQTNGSGPGGAPAPSAPAPAPAPIALSGSAEGQPVTGFQIPPARVND